MARLFCRIFLVGLLSFGLHAQEPRHRRLFVASVLAVAGAVSLDAASSVGNKACASCLDRT